MHRGLAGIGIVLFLALALANAAQAEVVVINSQDWMDVYSGMLYAATIGDSVLFLTNKRYATVLNEVMPAREPVLLFESERVPYKVNLAGTLRKQAHETKVVYTSGGRGLNLKLAAEVNATNFVLVDPTYGFNAVAAAPYALRMHGFVLFVDAQNADQVVAFLATRPQLDEVLVYGAIADRVQERLARFSPEVINTGNRYRDNAAIMRKYFARAPLVDQAVLTSGEFLESQVVGGAPVILIGKERVLNDTIAVVRESNLGTAIVIGNDLTRGAKQLKDATGVSTFVKVGQGIPQGVSEYEPIKALDMFFLPSLVIEMDLGAVRYNALEKVLEVVYRNRGSRAFFSGTISVLVDGETVQTLGDIQPQHLERNETRGFRYAVDLTEAIAGGRSMTADVFTTYGESIDSMDRAIAAQVDVSVSTAEDPCALELGKVTFDERTQRISVVLENAADVDCYASVALQDVLIDDRAEIVQFPQGVVPAGSSAKFKLKQRMTPVDLEDNPTVHARVFYGANDGLLFKVLDQTVPFTLAGEYTAIIIASVIVLLVGLVVVLLVMLKRAKSSLNRGKTTK
jgi:hypothetical protein